MTGMKAYSVQGDEYGTVVFAKHSVVARRKGANDLNIDFEDVESCRRMPELDEYAAAGKPVSWRVLVEEHGWQLECGWCYGRVYSDEPNRVWADDQTVYCCPECEARKTDHRISNPNLYGAQP